MVQGAAIATRFDHMTPRDSSIAKPPTELISPTTTPSSDDFRGIKTASSEVREEGGRVTWRRGVVDESNQSQATSRAPQNEASEECSQTANATLTGEALAGRELQGGARSPTGVVAAGHIEDWAPRSNAADRGLRVPYVMKNRLAGRMSDEAILVHFSSVEVRRAALPLERPGFSTSRACRPYHPCHRPAGRPWPERRCSAFR